MDLHEQRQLEVARQMAEVKARARPWRAIFALVLAAAAGIISSTVGRDFESWTGHDHAASKIVAASTAAAFCLLATVGILGLAGRTRQALPNAQVLAAAVSHPAQPSGATASAGANGQQAAPATPGDAPAPGPAASDGQQASPASLGLASSGQGGAAEKHQPAPGQQPPGGSSPQA